MYNLYLFLIIVMLYMDNHSDLYDLMAICNHLIYFVQNNITKITIMDLADRYPMKGSRDDLVGHLKKNLPYFKSNDAISTNNNYESMELNSQQIYFLNKLIGNKISNVYNPKNNFQ
jgi:hypothetical protein